MQDAALERPEPRWWPEPITEQEFEAFAPKVLEFNSGYLMGGPEDKDARLDLLRLLLKNCGLEAAASMGSKDDWREALEHAFIDFF